LARAVNNIRIAHLNRNEWMEPMRKITRLSIAIGGFLIVTSLILTGTVLLALLNIINVEIFADQVSASLIPFVFLTLGILDFAAGVILLRR